MGEQFGIFQLKLDFFKGISYMITRPMRPEILKKLHEGHLVMVKCIQRARESVWKPSVQHINETVSNCKG